MLRLAIAASLGLATGACFSPSYEPGLGCSESLACPVGQSCEADGVCRADDQFEPDGATRLMDGRVFNVIATASGFLLVLEEWECIRTFSFTPPGSPEALDNVCDELFNDSVEWLGLRWTGTEYVVVVETYGSQSVTTLDTQGMRLSGPTELTIPDGSHQGISVALSGTTLGVLAQVDQDLYYVPHDVNGNPLASPLHLDGVNDDDRAIAPTSDGFLVVWRSYPETHAMRLTTDGTLGPVSSTEDTYSRFEVTPIDSGFLLIGTLPESSGWALHSAPIDTANRFGEPTHIEAGGAPDQGWRYPSVAWNGTTMGVSWKLERSTETWDVYFAELARDGSPVSGPTRMRTSAPVDAVSTEVVWDEARGQYLVMWSDYESGGIWYTLVDPAGGS